VERLYIQPDGTVVPNFPGTGDVWVAQQDIPGILNPYVDKEPQLVEEHITNKPFFPAFP
jgi:hypothetical protein